jgi:hypothetical protein
MNDRPTDELGREATDPVAAMTQMYRLRWEGVKTIDLYRFMSGDPMEVPLTAVHQTVPNSRIPSRFWHQVIGEPTEDPLGQYEQFKQWEAEDRGFVREIRLNIWVGHPGDDAGHWSPLITFHMPNDEAQRIIETIRTVWAEEHRKERR